MSRDIMAMTTSNSISVKPRRRFHVALLYVFVDNLRHGHSIVNRQSWLSHLLFIENLKERKG